MNQVDQFAAAYQTRHDRLDSDELEFQQLFDAVLGRSQEFSATEVATVLRAIRDPLDYGQMDHLDAEVTTALLESPIESLLCGIDEAWDPVRRLAPGFLVDLLGQCGWRLKRSDDSHLPPTLASRIIGDSELLAALDACESGRLILGFAKRQA